MSVGTRIKSLRENRGWSQLSLAEKVKLNNSVVSRIESDKRPVEDHELALFADVFEVSTDYLLGRTDNPSPTKKGLLDGLDIPEGYEVSFYDLENMSEESKQKLLEYIKYLKFEEDQKKKRD